MFSFDCAADDIATVLGMIRMGEPVTPACEYGLASGETREDRGVVDRPCHRAL